MDYGSANEDKHRKKEFYTIEELRTALKQVIDRNYDERPYTEEQKRHLDLLEERIREVERQLFGKVASISRHLQAALDGGMRDYETFMVEGTIGMSSDNHLTEEKLENIDFPYSTSRIASQLSTEKWRNACNVQKKGSTITTGVI